jgi:four helix bundle protein
MFTLDELEVYTLAQEFSDKIWFMVEKWPPFAKFGLGRQLTDSSDSISSNISEGYGRYFFKENIKFCFYSRGSVLETKNHLQKAVKRKLIETKAHNELIDELKIIHRKLNGYIKFLKNSYLNSERTKTRIN